jgi:hypothetical protein
MIWLRRLGAVVLVTGVLVGTRGSARAEVIDLTAQLLAGGGGGAGLSGAQKDAAFFDKAAGGLWGARLGVELLFTDVWVEHWQMQGSSLLGTWTQFMAGADVSFGIGDPALGKDGKPGRQKTFAELGFYVGYGLATGQQVEPPLDNAELSDKGFLAQMSLGIDYRFSNFVSAGLTVPMTYGYMFKNGAANDESTRYQQFHAAGFLYLRLSVGTK